MAIELPPIYVGATAPGYSSSGGLPFPGPNPGVMLRNQMLQRHGYYAQGMWREMIMKLCQEQAANMRNGTFPGGIHPSFTRDCFGLQWADTYLSHNPGSTLAQALWHVGSKDPLSPPEASQPVEFSGSSLTPVAALGHFMYGKGTEASTNINSLGLKLNSASIPMLDNAISSAPEGSTVVSLDKVPYNTANDSWMTGLWLGNITLKIEGTITKSADGSVTFHGEARAYHDTYDANPGSWRSAFGESATDVLSKIQEYLKAQPYPIAIKGSYPIEIKK